MDVLFQCNQHGKDDYPNWTRNSMSINKQGYEVGIVEIDPPGVEYTSRPGPKETIRLSI